MGRLNKTMGMRVLLRSGVAQAWRETSRTLRVILVASPLLGVVLFALSAWGDRVGFWSNKPFLTNMMSALIGATFAVPFALVVLQRLSFNQAAQFERLTVRRLAARAGEELVEAAVSAIGGAVEGDPRRRSYDELAQLTERVLTEVGDLTELVDKADELTGLTHVGDECVIAKERADELIELVDAAADAWLTMFGDAPSLVSRILQIRSRWRFLTGTVRARILESGFPWVDVSTIEDCARSLDELEGLLPSAWLPDVALRTKNELAHYRRDRWELLSYSRGRDDEEVILPYDFIAEMSRRYQACSTFILRLSKFVERSEKIAIQLANVHH
jgi:hypothetical protein